MSILFIPSKSIMEIHFFSFLLKAFPTTNFEFRIFDLNDAPLIHYSQQSGDSSSQSLGHPRHQVFVPTVREAINKTYFLKI